MGELEWLNWRLSELSPVLHDGVMQFIDALNAIVEQGPKAGEVESATDCHRVVRAWDVDNP